MVGVVVAVVEVWAKGKKRNPSNHFDSREKRVVARLLSICTNTYIHANLV